MSNKSIAVSVVLAGVVILMGLRRMLLAGLCLGLAVAGVILMRRQRQSKLTA
jgi:uncharacterized membrane protein